MDGLSGLLKDYDLLEKEKQELIKKLILQEYKHVQDHEWMRTTLQEINRLEGYKYNRLIMQNKIHYNLSKSNQKFQIISNEEFARRIMEY